MVDIVVGPNQKLFRVHKDLLCSKEPYFQAMFNGGFLETTDQAAKLLEDDPDMSGLFLGWLYAGRLTPIPLQTKSKTDSKSSPDTSNCTAFRKRLSLQGLWTVL